MSNVRDTNIQKPQSAISIEISLVTREIETKVLLVTVHTERDKNIATF